MHGTERRTSLAPGLIAALVLHAIAVLLVVLFAPKANLHMGGDAVPVTIVTSMPMTAPETAPVAQEAEAPPSPEVAPPAPQPAAAVTPKPVDARQKGNQTANTYAPLNLQDIIDKAQPVKAGGGARPSSVVKTAKATQVGPKTPPSGAALGGFVDKVGKLWNIDCDVGATRSAVVKVRVTINDDGRLPPGSPPVVVNPSQNAVFAGPEAAAVRAIKSGQPYSLAEVPSALRNQPFVVTFYGEDVCRGR